MEQCDRIILPQELELYGTFDMKKAIEIYDLGYTVAKKNMDIILKDIEQLKLQD
jgi:predicted acylesterase/phospholipase RssA